MDSDKKQQFVNLILATAEYYKNTLSEMVIEIYWEGLKDFDIDLIQKALNVHIRDSELGRFMPRIADVMKHLTGSSDDKALMAWNKVFEAMQKYGYYNSVVFDDLIIHAVIQDQGGWVRFSEYYNSLTDKEFPFFKKDFMENYKMRINHRRSDTPKILIGFYEQENATSGHEWNEPPKTIGDKNKCKLIIESKQIGLIENE
jgi:hypothetical protein